MSRALAALLLVATALAGCVVDVVLDLGRCVDGGGVERDSGEAYTAGCQTCTCEGGREVCQSSCCSFEGAEVELGASLLSADGCTTCACQSDGTLACSQADSCPACSGEPIVCPDPPAGCTNQAVCTDVGWACERTCEGCDMAANGTFMGCPPPPPGCWFTGPICDDGAWACGDLVCQGCQGDPIDCSDASTMGCVGYPVCDGVDWVCDISCDDPNCPDPVIDCTDPNLPPECYAYAVCDPMIGWACQFECYPGCMGPPPSCESMLPDCTGVATCDGVEWQCELVCQ